jgi:hypothetical protein
MAGRSANVSVTVKGEAEFTAARKEIARDLDRIERDAEDTADDIKDAFRKLSPELDTSEIRKALDLADQLDGMVADFTIDTDLAEIQEAEKIAKALRSFQGRVDLDVEGREELADALDLAEKMDQIREVKVQVQGLQDLERAERLAADLEQRRTIPIDAQAADLVRLGDQITEAGETGADGIADAMGGIDFDSIGSSGLGQLTGALGAAGPWAAVAGAVAVVFSDELAEGFDQGFNARRNDLERSVRTGLSDFELEDVGAAAGEAWSAGFGEGLEGLKDTAALLKVELEGVGSAVDLGDATAQSQVFADVWGVDIPTQINLARRLIAQDLVDDHEGAMDLMIDTAQRFPIAYEEIFEVLNEFGPVFDKMGISGQDAARVIGEAWQQGLLPNIDRGAELFEEFNIEVTDSAGRARPAIEALGISFEDMQAKLASGRGAEAMDEIATALLGVENESTRNALAMEIFGASIESASDPTAVLELLASIDEVDESLAGTADQAVATAEQMVSGWDRTKAAAMDFGGVIGGEVREELDAAWVSWDRFRGALTGDELEGMARQVSDSSAELRGLKDEAVLAGDELGEMEGAVSSLDDALAEFSGRFDADELFIGLEEQIARTVETATAADGEFLNLDGSFNLLDETGRELNQTFIDLAQEQDSLISSFLDGTISADQLDGGLGRVRQGVIDARMVMDDGRAEAERYADGLLDIPTDIETEIDAKSNVPAVTSEAERRLRGIDGMTATTYIRSVTVSGSTGTRIGASAKRQHGGPVTAGEPYTVGEEGEELFVPGEDGDIIDAAMTRSMLGSSRGGSAGGGGGRRDVLEIRSGGSEVEDFLIGLLRKAVRNRGGIDVVFN